jgi:hypothetical protein
MPTEFHAPRDPATSAAPSSDELPLFRFGLRQLLAFVSLVSLLMAAMVMSTGWTALALLLATLVVSFHLFSTALGSQLRWHANRLQNQQSATPGMEKLPSLPRYESSQPPPRSPWHKRRSTPLPWLARWIAAASMLGAAAGALLLSSTIGHRSSLVGIAVGAFSLGVVAGWSAFVGYSFYSVFRHGVGDAMAQDRQDQSR